MSIFSSLPALFIASILGCFTDEGSYPLQMAQVTCEFYYNCAKAGFLSEWDDLGECLEDAEEEIEDQEDYLDDCDFDAENGAECLAAMQAYARSCSEDDGEEVEDACDDVYEDCG